MKYDFNWIKNPEVYSVNERKKHAFLNHENVGLSLNGEWEIKKFNTLPEDFFETTFSETIKLPQNLEFANYSPFQYTNKQYPWDGREAINQPHLPTNNPVFLLSKKFEVNKDFLDNKSFVTFEGVEPGAFVFLNQEFVGYFEDSFTESEFELTDKLQEKNELMLVIFRYNTGSWLEDQDFFRLSGVFRDINIHFEKNGYLRDIALTTNFENDFKIAKIKVELDTDADVIEVYLNGELKDVSDLTIINPKLWSAELPHLYELKFLAYKDGVKVDQVMIDYGLREFKIVGNVMYLNGKRIIFNGVNRHEFSCYNGRAITKGEIDKDLKIIKDHNINAVRCSHYPNNHYFYQRCNEIGLYVIDEVNLETHGTWQRFNEIVIDENTLPSDKVEWRAAVLQRAINMFQRSKNNSCILMNSCGNEAAGGKTIFEMSEYFRRVCNYRVVHYESVFNDNRYPDTTDVYSRMYAYVSELKEIVPEIAKPVILCEYSHAMGNSIGAIEKYQELTEQFINYQGGFIWDFKDQAIMVNNHLVAGNYFARPNDYNFCANGLILADNELTSKIEQVKYTYQPLKFNFDQGKLEIKNLWLFKSTDGITFKYRILEDGIILREMEFELIVEPQTSEIISLDISDYNLNDAEFILQIEAFSDMKVAQFEKVLSKYENGIEFEPLQLIDTCNNIGLNGTKAKLLINKLTGKLESICYEDYEYLRSGLSLEFSRAFVDNDIGCGNDFLWANSLLASYFQYPSKIVAENNKAIVNFIMPNEFDAVIEYSISKNDLLKVKLKLDLKGKNIPTYGVRLNLKNEFSQIKWYGSSLKDYQVDRCTGGLTGIYNSTKKEQMEVYTRIQDTGNKGNLRYFSVLNENNHGLTILSDEKFMASVLPYNSMQMINMVDAFDLTNTQNTYLSIFKTKAGVGGDDSWGAKIHKEFTIDTTDKLEFEFYIQVI